MKWQKQKFSKRSSYIGCLHTPHHEKRAIPVDHHTRLTSVENRRLRSRLASAFANQIAHPKKQHFTDLKQKAIKVRKVLHNFCWSFKFNLSKKSGYEMKAAESSRFSRHTILPNTLVCVYAVGEHIDWPFKKIIIGPKQEKHVNRFKRVDHVKVWQPRGLAPKSEANLKIFRFPQEWTYFFVG